MKAPPDGYTLLLVAAAAVTSALLYDKLNFNLIRDIVPVASISGEPQILALHPPIPANTVSEFIAYAKAKPWQDQHGIGWQRNSGAYRRRVV